MATKKVNEEQPVTAEYATEAPVDAWHDLVEVYIPRGTHSEKSIFVGINSRDFLVPLGKRVKVPRPVAEILHEMQDREEELRNMRENIPDEG